MIPGLYSTGEERAVCHNCWGAFRSLNHRPLSNVKTSNPQTSQYLVVFTTVLTAECCTYYWGVTAHLGTAAIMRPHYFVFVKFTGTKNINSRESAVGRCGARNLAGIWDFFPTNSRSTVGPTRSPTERISVLLGVMWPGRDADHSPPNCVDVKEWSYQYNTSIYLHRICSDNFTFFTFTFKHTTLKVKQTTYLIWLTQHYVHTLQVY